MKNKKFKTATGAVVAGTLLLAVGAFAYFTDRADLQESGTAGTVAIDVTSDVDLKDAEGKNILNPGDLRDASFKVTNTGNKSIDVRTTIKVTSSKPMTTTGQAEYEIYNRADVELVTGEGYKPKAGAQPLQTRTISADGLVITYTPADYVLNGNSARHAEVETEDAAAGAYERDNDYVLVFKGASANAFQNSIVTVDVLAEAKQHRNTEAGWTVVAQESFTTGNFNQNAVPAAE